MKTNQTRPFVQSPRVATGALALLQLALVLALVSPASAQLMHDWVTRRDGGGAFVVTDSQGAVYRTGWTQTGTRFSDILTVKYAPDGTQVWAVTYGPPSGNGGNGVGITIDSAGDILVLGTSECDFLVIKYDAADGSIIWTSQHDGGNCPERPSAFTTDDAGNIYVTGFTRPAGGVNGEDFYTYKMDSAGNVLWTATYVGPGPFLNSHDRAVDIALDSNGDVFVTGPSTSVFGWRNFVTIKYRATDGAQLWLARLDFRALESVALLISPEDDVYVTGSAENGLPPFVTVKHDGNDGSEMWVSVNLQPWIFGEAFGMALDSQGDVYVTGSLDPDGNRSNQNDNVVTMRLRADTGARRWLSIFGQNGLFQRDGGLAIAIDAQDNVFVAGHTSSFGATNDLLLLLYDAVTGQVVDQGTFDVPSELAQGEAMTLDSAQNLIVAGTTRSTGGPSSPADFLTLKFPAQAGCYADCDQSTGVGVLDILDFLCFQNSFVGGGSYACDCDVSTGPGVCDIIDFLCFQNAFVAGCP